MGYLIEIIFVACMVTSPWECKEHRLRYAENMTPFQCIMKAQIELAKWKEEHPAWEIEKYTCDRVRFHEAQL